MESEVVRVVVMGVSGSGKSTIGRGLAAALDARFVDGDDVHPDANIEKMAAGVPLTDTDRGPWLDRLTEELGNSDRLVVACSALARRYRDRLRRAGGVRFVFLDLDLATATARVTKRPDHFMGSAMVDSQFAVLERPLGDEHDVVTVAATTPPPVVVAVVESALRSRGEPPPPPSDE